MLDTIPNHILGMLKMANIRTEAIPEPCHADSAAINCQVMATTSIKIIS